MRFKLMTTSVIDRNTTNYSLPLTDLCKYYIIKSIIAHNYERYLGQDIAIIVDNHNRYTLPGSKCSLSLTGHNFQ